MSSSVYQTQSGQWAFVLIDDDGVDVVRGAGYETQEEAQQAADEQLASYQ